MFTLCALATMGLLGAVIARVLVLLFNGTPPLTVLLITLMLGTVRRSSSRLFSPDGANPKPFFKLLPDWGHSFGRFSLRFDNTILLTTKLGRGAGHQSREPERGSSSGHGHHL
jgi:branched-chain amino acid transport system permease protein